MRVISFNANGIRAAERKGLTAFLREHEPDIVCLQELKAHAELMANLELFDDFHQYWHCAQRKGYSGVGILARKRADHVVCGFGIEAYEQEGRVIQADFSDLSVLSVYVPSGSSRDQRQTFKMAFLANFYRHIASLLAEGRELLICGDINIAHRKIDLKNWRSNQKNSGFLPEERLWLDGFLELGLVDTYRQLIGPDTASYSWWSLRSGARARNVGWRLDYQFATAKLAASARCGQIPQEPPLSDHAPVIVDYDRQLQKEKRIE